MAPSETPPPSAQTLEASAKAAGAKGGLPPVHLWDPPYRGEIDIRIARDGTWYHEGTVITRAPLVRLFSTILKLEDGRFYLVTPVEKVGITVEDAPFVAVDFEVSGSGEQQRLTFETNVGDLAEAGPDHPIRVERDPESGAPAPYVMIRAGLEALIDRKSFYRLIDLGVLAEHAGDSWFGLWSGGEFFPLIPAAELP